MSMRHSVEPNDESLRALRSNGDEQPAGSRAGRLTTHVALPRKDTPVLLVPRRSARAATAAIAAYTTPTTLTAWAKSRVGLVLASVGALRFFPPGMTLGGAGSLVEHCQMMLGRDDLVMSVHLGPARVNRKPVLRFMDGQGQAVAFVKLGVNDLTRARVKSEERALRALESKEIPGLVVPRIVEAGEWEGTAFLMLSPVHTAGLKPGPELRHRAQRSLVQAFALSTEPLTRTQWWRATSARLDRCDPRIEDVRRLLQAADVLARRDGDSAVQVGASHGDWTPWNTSVVDGDVVAWDWERFSTDRPLGWDEIHYRVSAHPQGVAQGMRDELRGLREIDVGSEIDEITLGSYLLDRGTNFVADRHDVAGSPNGPLSAWLLPTLEALLADGRGG